MHWQRPRRRAPAPGDAALEFLSDADARDLVRAAQQYDDRAFTRLYEIYADRIFRYVYARVGDRPRAEEVTSEVFVRLLESMANFQAAKQRQALALTGWIYRIAHNLVIDEYRRRQARGEMEMGLEAIEDLEADEIPMEWHLTRADLQAALRQLTDEQQTVILLRFQEGMTSVEIARALGKTETAIKALQRRGLAALARWLAPAPPVIIKERASGSL